MTAQLFRPEPGSLVRLRQRDWVVLPSNDPDLLLVKPMGGSEEETTGIYLPLALPEDQPEPSQFPHPTADDLGDISTARLLHNAARLSFRNGAGPFRCLAKLSFRPRSYQIVPLIMALRQEIVRLLIADDVGVGKTVESLLIVRELLERRKIERFAVVCLPHLCEQWQEEIRSKLELDAVIIRSNTQARLDREIQGDTSVFEYYPFQVISIDYIKSDARRNVFVQQGPELTIVDEAHTCARPVGASTSQQQRHQLVRQLADKAGQHLVLLTATPHSGKPEEFHSLLGLLRPEFEVLDLPSSNQAQRRELARHFIQRKRADVEKWLGEETPFPKRNAEEVGYPLARRYDACFNDLLAFTRELVAGSRAGPRRKRVQYWTALGLLRGVMSSPRAGAEMLHSRLENAREEETPEGEDPEDSSVHDNPLAFESDRTPTQWLERTPWSDTQKRSLAQFAERLEALANPRDDAKLQAARTVVEQLLRQGLNPVVFCRYIATANYVGEQLAALLKKEFPKLDLQVVTSEDADEVRRQRIDDMQESPLRVLVATDCLSEGINLQDLFTAVIHYDLPWNPNRLEQREGRVDRFGQTAPVVRTCLLYAQDNPIDGIVLEVILRKIREIRRSTGIIIPFPEDSRGIIDTVAEALLLNPDRRVGMKRDNNLEFDFAEFTEAESNRLQVSRKLDEAEAREKVSRSIFAQNAIKADEVEADLRTIDESIGNPQAVREFVESACLLAGAQFTPLKDGSLFRLHTVNLPESLKATLPAKPDVLVSFNSPTPEGALYLGRNHPFVEQLCQLLLANTVHRRTPRAARTAVIRSRMVSLKTTLLLLRVRNVITEKARGFRVVAEEMLVWGYRGDPANRDFLTVEEARRLLGEISATANLSPEARTEFLNNELQFLDPLRPELDRLADDRCQHLVSAHERFTHLVDGTKPHEHQFQVVYPVLPMDVLGVYVVLPNLNR